MGVTTHTTIVLSPQYLVSAWHNRLSSAMSVFGGPMRECGWTAIGLKGQDSTALILENSVKHASEYFVPMICPFLRDECKTSQCVMWKDTDCLIRLYLEINSLIPEEESPFQEIFKDSEVDAPSNSGKSKNKN